MRLQRTPAASSAGSGWASIDGTTDSSTFDVGHTSRHTPGVGEPLHQLGVLDRAHAVLDAVGAERVERADDRLGPGQLARVGHAEQARVPGDREGLGERLGRPVGLVVGQAEADTPRPAYFAARFAWSTASDGSTVRSAATMIPTPTPKSRAASAAASSTISSVSSGGPMCSLWCGR